MEEKAQNQLLSEQGGHPVSGSKYTIQRAGIKVTILKDFFLNSFFHEIGSGIRISVKTVPMES